MADAQGRFSMTSAPYAQRRGRSRPAWSFAPSTTVVNVPRPGAFSLKFSIGAARLWRG